MRYFAVCLGLLWPCSQASAVLIGTGTGTGNTTAPANDFGFANVGIFGSGSAVYLGNGWVLTAAHVYDNSGGTPTQAWFNDSFYKVVPNSGVQLTNPPGVAGTPYSDLEMFKLATTPNLPSVMIAPTAPAAGWQVTMVGNGRDRSNNQTAYWTPAWLPSSTPTALGGDTWATMQDLRWGTNVIDVTGGTQGVNGNYEVAFSTSFSAKGTTYEAQGTPGDSGGGVFHQDPATGAWSLAGIMFSTTALAGQPFGISVFGNTTWSADLYYYRTQIYKTEAIPGDVNFDGIVNSQDLAIVISNWLKTGTGANAPAGDVNHDGIVNSQDLAIISSLASSANSNGMAVGVPEPSGFALSLAALASLLVVARKRLRRSTAVS
jgi:hypothetical protein